MLERHGLDGHRYLDICLSEHLLKTVEGQARQLGLDQVCVLNGVSGIVINSAEVKTVVKSTYQGGPAS